MEKAREAASRARSCQTIKKHQHNLTLPGRLLHSSRFLILPTFNISVAASTHLISKNTYFTVASDPLAVAREMRLAEATRIVFHVGLVHELKIQKREAGGKGW